MLNVYRVRLYPNKRMAEYFNKNIGSCRFVYNNALAFSIEHHEKNKDLDKEHREKRPSGYDLCKRLPGLKQEYDWLKEVDSQALKYACICVDTAFKNFFRRVKQGVNPGFPRYKSKYRGSQSFTLTQGNNLAVNFAVRSLRIPKMGYIRCRGLRSFEGKIQRMTITRVPSGKYFCSILVKDELPEVDIVPVDDPGKLTVVDLGISKLAFVESGNKKVNVEHPKFIEKLHKQLARQQKKLSKKKDKSSSNYQKQKIRVARIYEKISDLRKNYAHHISKDLSTLASGVVIEDIDIAGLMKKLPPVTDAEGNYLPNGRKMQKKWNTLIADASWRTLINMIQYKSSRQGKPVILIDPVVGPNKICSQCNYYNDDVTLDVKKWICPECNAHHERHKNCIANMRKMAFEFGTVEQVRKPE